MRREGSSSAFPAHGGRQKHGGGRIHNGSGGEDHLRRGDPLEADRATIQVYEDRPDSGSAKGHRRRETASRGARPRLLGSVYDGVQRPCTRSGRRAATSSEGQSAPPLDRENGEFRPVPGKGTWSDRGCPGRRGGDPARRPPRDGPAGKRGNDRPNPGGDVPGPSPVAFLADGTALPMVQRWPVRTPRPFRKRLPPMVPFITGQRVFDVLFPSRGRGGDHPRWVRNREDRRGASLARHAGPTSSSSWGAGSAGTKMTEVLADFPELVTPSTGSAYGETVLVVNTSNMPVAARRGFRLHRDHDRGDYRDMGTVALLADSISRWRRLSAKSPSRLEEMPGEEDTRPTSPAALPASTNGAARSLPGGGTEGTVTIVSAVSLRGGLLGARHAKLPADRRRLWPRPRPGASPSFPAVDWRRATPSTPGRSTTGSGKRVSVECTALRGGLMALLQREEELQEVVRWWGSTRSRSRSGSS